MSDTNRSIREAQVYIGFQKQTCQSWTKLKVETSSSQKLIYLQLLAIFD